MSGRAVASVAGLVLATLGLATLRPGAAVVKSAPAPPFPSTRPGDWIGRPATWQELRGRVVLLDVWTFG